MELQYLLNLSIATENFEAKAGQLYSFLATPGKQCLPPKVSPGGLRVVLLSILDGYWGLQYLLNLSITTENVEAKAVRLYSFSATPGKQYLPPKVSPGGLRDRTVEYTTWVLGITVIAQSFHCNREFRSCSAILIFRTGSGNSSVAMAASLFRPVLGSIPGSNTELDRRSVNPSLQSGNGEPGSE